MRVRDLKGWSPSWGGAYSGLDKFAHGEEGTLISARWNWERNPQNKYLSVTIEYEGRQHSGVIQGDSALLERLHSLLSAQAGCPIAEIGNFEIPQS